MAISDHFQFMGMIVSGDIGPFTVYTDRFGRKIIFPKAPPNKPPTQLQLDHRDRFRLAQQEYMARTSAERATWERIAHKSSICMTGQNLYIHIAMKGGLTNLATMLRQTNETVIPPTIV